MNQRQITIIPVLRGYLVKVGCRDIIYASGEIGYLVNDLREYLLTKDTLAYEADFIKEHGTHLGVPVVAEAVPMPDYPPSNKYHEETPSTRPGGVL